MLSECARATSAAESRFRIGTPNSLPRAVTIVALDAPGGRIVDELAAQSWGRARFRHARELTGAGALIDEVAGADLVVMVASVGPDVSVAAAIGEMCRLSRVTTTTLVLADPHVDRDETSRTLAQLRPHTDMLVAASSADYFGDLLVALRA